MAYIILKSAARQIGLREFGCHSTRKTFGYYFYQKYKDVAMLQRIFNHSSLLSYWNMGAKFNRLLTETVRFNGQNR